MGKVLITESILQDTANAIRSKTGSQDTIKPSEFAENISDISSESSPYMRASKAELDLINANAGDYGIVYSYSQTYYQPSDGNITVYFPRKVVLDSAITDTYKCYLGSSSKYIELSPTQFRIRNLITNTVKYTSADGITYTKTSGADSYSMGTIGDASEFYDSMKFFLLKTRQATFNALYQYFDEWVPAYMGLTTTPADVIKDKTFISDADTTTQTGILWGDNKDTFTTFKNLLLSFDTSTWTTISFKNGDYRLLDLVSKLNTSNLTSAVSMFNGFKMRPTGATQLLDLTHLDFSKCTSMGNSFQNFGYISQEGASDKLIIKLNANFSTASTFSSMFQDSEFSEIYLNDLTTSATSAISTFSGCSKLEAIHISNMECGNTLRMDSAFFGCSSLTTLDISIKGTKPVISILEKAFSGCSSLTEIDLSMFDLSNLTFGNELFKGCVNLMKIDFSTFDMHNLTSMGDAFSDIPSNCEIKVKSQAEKSWFATYYSRLTNVIIV